LGLGPDLIGDLAVVSEMAYGMVAHYLVVFRDFYMHPIGKPKFETLVSNTVAKYIDSVTKTPMRSADIIKSLDANLLQEGGKAWQYVSLIAAKAEDFTKRLGLNLIVSPPSHADEATRDLIELIISFAFISASAMHYLYVVEVDKLITSSEDSIQNRIAFSYSLLLQTDLQRLSQLDVGIYGEVSKALGLVSLDELKMAYSPRKWFSGAFPVIRRLISIAKEAPQEAIKHIRETCTKAKSHSRKAVDYLSMHVPDFIRFGK
jgi:hypothetical protein